MKLMLPSNILLCSFQYLQKSFLAVILAYSRERNYFYAYFVFRTLTAMVADGSVQCLALAYVVNQA